MKNIKLEREEQKVYTILEVAEIVFNDLDNELLTRDELIERINETGYLLPLRATRNNVTKILYVQDDAKNKFKSVVGKKDDRKCVRFQLKNPKPAIVLTKEDNAIYGNVDTWEKERYQNKNSSNINRGPVFKPKTETTEKKKGQNYKELSDEIKKKVIEWEKKLPEDESLEIKEIKEFEMGKQEKKKEVSLETLKYYEDKLESYKEKVMSRRNEEMHKQKIFAFTREELVRMDWNPLPGETFRKTQLKVLTDAIYKVRDQLEEQMNCKLPLKSYDDKILEDFKYCEKQRLRKINKQKLLLAIKLENIAKLDLKKGEEKKNEAKEFYKQKCFEIETDYEKKIDRINEEIVEAERLRKNGNSLKNLIHSQNHSQNHNQNHSQNHYE